MSVEYLHSIRLAKPCFEHADAVREALVRQGYFVYRVAPDVIQFVGSGSNDARKQAMWVAELVQGIEACGVEVVLAPTWTAEKEAWMLGEDCTLVGVPLDERVGSPRRVVLEMMDVDPVEAHLALFEVAADVRDIKQTLRRAVLEFVNGPAFVDVLDALDIDAHQFNWGDALIQVPREVWLRHGLRYMPNAVPREHVVVDHNERLAE